MRLNPVSPLYVAMCAGLFLMATADVFEASAEDGNGPVGGAFVSDAQSDSLDAPKPRDPFWPVGYVPKKVVRVKEKTPPKWALNGIDSSEAPRVPLWDEARKRVDVRGISFVRDKVSGAPRYLAIIAGKLIETGDVVSAKYEGRIYRWRVVGITEEGVSLQKVDVRGE